MKNNTKTQLNARVPVPMRNALKGVSGMSLLTLEQIAEDAIRFYFGREDRDVLRRRKVCIGALERYSKGQDRPFDRPLTPLESNALTAPA